MMEKKEQQTRSKVLFYNDFILSSEPHNYFFSF